MKQSRVVHRRWHLSKRITVPLGDDSYQLPSPWSFRETVLRALYAMLKGQKVWGRQLKRGRYRTFGPQSSGQQSTREQGSMGRTNGWVRRTQQNQYMKRSTQAQNNITVKSGLQSNRASFGTKMIPLFGSIMFVHYRSPFDHCQPTSKATTSRF